MSFYPFFVSLGVIFTTEMPKVFVSIFLTWKSYGFFANNWLKSNDMPVFEVRVVDLLPYTERQLSGFSPLIAGQFPLTSVSMNCTYS